MRQLTAEESVQIFEKEDMYRQIVEYSFETTVIHADHNILYINQSGADFLRASKEQIMGRSILDIHQENSKDFIRQRIRKSMDEDIIGELIEITIFRLDVGSIDEEKAKQLLDAIPEKLQTQQLHYIVIDFSGISPILTGLTAELARKAFGWFLTDAFLKRVPNRISMTPLFEKTAVFVLSGTIPVNRPYP